MAGRNEVQGMAEEVFIPKWCCEITSSKIRALSPTMRGEGVIHTDYLDGNEKTLGLTDSLLQSCCVQVDNLIFLQKINIPADRSQPAFPWFLPHQLLPVEQNHPLTLSLPQHWSTWEPLYYIDSSFFCLPPRTTPSPEQLPQSVGGYKTCAMSGKMCQVSWVYLWSVDSELSQNGMKGT